VAENKQIAAAKLEYIRRRAKGEDVNLSELARKLGVNYSTLRRHKAKDDWDNAPYRRKGGAPKGNKNSVGHKSSVPLGNKNAEKDGAYSAVFLDKLTEDDKAYTDMTPAESLPNLMIELKILRVRERHTLAAIERYEAEHEETLHLSSLMDMRTPGGGEDGAEQSMGMYTSDTAFARIEKLNEALYKIQGRIAAVLNSIHSIEEAASRAKLERERLEIMRMRASGTFEIDGEDGAE